MKMTEQGIRYLLVGVFNTIFGYGFFALLEISAGHVIPYMVVLLIAQVVSTFVAYVLYRSLVFKVRGRFWRDLVRFSLVYAGAFAVNLVLLPVMVSVLGWSVLLSQALIVGGTVIASFFAHRNFSFRRPPGEGRP
jgi:putative flippase GtrA